MGRSLYIDIDVCNCHACIPLNVYIYTIVAIKPLMNRNGVTNSGRRILFLRVALLFRVWVCIVELTKLQRERRVSTCSEYNELLPTQWIIKYSECAVS